MADVRDKDDTGIGKIDQRWGHAMRFRALDGRSGPPDRSQYAKEERGAAQVGWIGVLRSRKADTQALQFVKAVLGCATADVGFSL